MGTIKKVHKKLGETMLISSIMEDILEGLAQNSKPAAVQDDQWETNFHSRLDSVKDQLNDDLHGKIKSFWNIRRGLMHDIKFPFATNREFKNYLNDGREILDEIIRTQNLSKKYSDFDEDKLTAIGKLVYQSTFAENYIDKKCKEKKIVLFTYDRKRKSMPAKIEERIEKIKKKNLQSKRVKYDKIRKWYSQRNQLIHSYEKLSAATVEELQEFVDSISIIVNIAK